MLILIEQTNYCNLQCRNCSNRLHQRPRGYMTPKRFKSIIDQLLEKDAEGYKKMRIALHGVGEPFLNTYLWENLDYLQEKGFTNVDFSTNGNLLTEENIEKLMKYTCISWLRVSLNSSRKELMELINTGSDFDLVVKNIRNLLDLVAYYDDPFQVVIQKMITRKNEDEGVGDYYNVLRRRNFKYMEKRLHTYHHQTDDTELSFPDGDMTKCIFGATLFIHWDGDMVGCCADDTKTQVFGNIKDGIFSKKVQDKKNQYNKELQDRDFTNLPFCKKCLGL